MATNRLQETFGLLIVTACLLFWAQKLLDAFSDDFHQVEIAYKSGASLNIQPGLKAEQIRKTLTIHGYYKDERDVKLIADSLAQKVNNQRKSLLNLGELNKSTYSINIIQGWLVTTGGQDIQERFQLSRRNLGLDSLLFMKDRSGVVSLPATVVVSRGNLSLSGFVRSGGSEGPLMPGVIVKLHKHSQWSPVGNTNIKLDTIQNDERALRIVGRDPSGRMAEYTTIHYAQTNEKGFFSFKGLIKDSSYSVIPIKSGFEFGLRKGNNPFLESQEVTFIGKPHFIRLFNSTVFNQIKEDYAFTTRTPTEFKDQFWSILVLFIAGFWLIHGIWIWRGFTGDQYLLPIVFFLLGVSLLLMLSIPNPLQDTQNVFKAEYLFGLGLGWLGLLGLTVIPFTNLDAIYKSGFFEFLWLPVVYFRNRKKLATMTAEERRMWRNKRYQKQTGWTWLILSIGFLAWVLLAGFGPGTSDVKVNVRLGFQFQPSEITKYLMVVFFASYFVAREHYILHGKGLKRLYEFFAAIVFTLVILGAYLAAKDMGPALVLGLTFALYYHLMRGGMLGSILILIAYWVGLTFLPVSPWVVCLLTGVLLFFICIPKNKQDSVQEAPVIVWLVVTVFTLGDSLNSLFPGVGDRLASRKEMWLHPWENNLPFGGDHLAHSIWTLASGGWVGQGLGKGHASTMPAAHTDMILSSIGEEMGLITLLILILLYLTLLYRIIIASIGRSSTFLKFVGLGIGFSIGIQFLLIACGSIGLLPLTGIAVPFLSYGTTSLLCNLVAIGAVLQISTQPAEQNVELTYRNMTFAFLGVWSVAIILLAKELFLVQILHGNEYVVRPARVLNRESVPIYSYNPRIRLLTNKLPTGTIYDRNNLILATSFPDSIRAAVNSLTYAGLVESELKTLANQSSLRYYPFGNHLFFWVGDANTNLLWGTPAGYFAEHRHLSLLRGFNNQSTDPSDTLIGAYSRLNRFEPITELGQPLIKYDYHEIADILREGINGPRFQELKVKNKNLKLAVDAPLQRDIQETLSLSKFKDKRISVVVLDARSGDVLASAIHPIADYTMIKARADQTPTESELLDPQSFKFSDRDLGLTYATPPGSTAKIITALAAFNNLGSEAPNVKFYVSKGQKFRGGEPIGEVDMRDAIVNSSNVYFINLANAKHLDQELSDLYTATGIFIGNYPKTRSDYLFGDQPLDTVLIRKIQTKWQREIFSDRRNTYKLNVTETKNKPKSEFKSEFSYLAWGQGKMNATPLALARIGGIIANKGFLMPSNYVLEKKGVKVLLSSGIRVVKSSDYTDRLTEYMREQSTGKFNKIKVAGKTGTPERSIDEAYDGWYVFFAPTVDKKSYTVVCIRIELGDQSTNAVALANEIYPILNKRNYLGSF